ncbi:MAG: PIN domain nuclease [Actinomycetia bacterium]|nr:PIN domain nuclease [Actinomycetes bacterium]
MILADTSAWIEFDRASGSAVDTRMTELISAGNGLAVSEPIVMEVLAGARTDEREMQLRSLLQQFPRIPYDSAPDFDGATRIYRRCRRVGITPRGMVDCMIAAVAWRTRATLLAYDRDLAQIAQVMDIEQDDASLRA